MTKMQKYPISLCLSNTVILSLVKFEKKNFLTTEKTAFFLHVSHTASIGGN